MFIPYFKDNIFQGNVEVPHRFWKGTQSKYEKTRNKNIDLIWELFKKHHENFQKLELNYKENKIETSS